MTPVIIHPRVHVPVAAADTPSVDRSVGGATSERTIYAAAILAMTMLFLIGVGLPCAIAFGWPAGAGLGAMSAVWGGPGFGVMAASAVAEVRRAEAD